MYEITIWTTKKTHIEYLKRQTSCFIRSINGVYATISINKRHGISFAVSSLFSDQIKRKLTPILTEILCLGFKADYFIERLKVPKTPLKNLLIGTMSLFDNQADYNSTKGLFSWDKPIYLEGYFNFLMTSIKRRWEEVAQLCDNNRLLFSDVEVGKEFLTFLVQSMPFKHEKLSLECCQNDYHLFDEHEQIMGNLWQYLDGATPQEMALLDLVKNKSKRLKIYEACSFFDELTMQLLNQMFDVKLIEKS